MNLALLLAPPPRLLALRESVLGARLVILRAPAGFGKTALVQAWLDGLDRPFSWIELGHDNLPPHPRASDILVIDRLELAKAEECGVLSTLSAQARPGAPMILIGRGALPLPLGRQRLEGTVTELGASELARNDEEARNALAAADLPAPHDLLRLAEGWPAALALGAAILARTGCEDAIDNLGERHELYEYLSEEVLPPRDSHQERLLLATLELDNFSAAELDLRLGRQDSAACLAQLSRDCPPLLPLDDRGLRYRLHPLLKQALRRRRREGTRSSGLENGSDPESSPKASLPEPGPLVRGAAGNQARPPLLDYGDRARPQEPRPPGGAEALLSRREVELLGVLARGHSPDEAAEILFISPHTVRTHIRNIYGKLGTRRLVETLNRAAELGVLAPADPVRSYHGPAVGRGDEGGPRDRLPIPR